MLRARKTASLLLCGLLCNLIVGVTIGSGPAAGAFRSRLTASGKTDALTFEASARADQSRAVSPLRPVRSQTSSIGKSLAIVPHAAPIVIDRTAGTVAADRLARLVSAFVRPGSIRGPPPQLTL
jgi:hypothetical protein